VRKRKAEEADAIARERAKAARSGAREAYITLLAEAVKDPDASWRDAAPRLERDPQGRGAPPAELLEHGEREALFREHVAALCARGEADLRALLAARLRDVDAWRARAARGEGPLARWEDALAEVLAGEPATERCPRSARQALWREHVDALLAKRPLDGAAAAGA
jgi:hypothetical protein